MKKQIYYMFKSLVILFFILLKSDSFSQTYEWAHSIGNAGDDYGYSIAVDAAGNVYIAGFFNGTADFDPSPPVANLTSAGGKDLFIAKYNSSGNFIWAHNAGGTGDDAAEALALDNAGNVYITGYFYGTADFDPGTGIADLVYAGGSYGDIFIAKYEGASGNYIWAKGIGSNPGADWGQSMAVDASGSAYITGFFTGTADFDPEEGTVNLTSIGSQDIFFAKYDLSGNYVWAHSIGSTPPLRNDIGYGIALDHAGMNVYITGTFNSNISPAVGTADFNPDTSLTANLITNGNYADIFLAKYDADSGHYVWAFNVGSIFPDYAQGVKTDIIDNIYIVGEFQNTADFDPGPNVNNISASGNILSPFIAKYEASEKFVWADAIVNTGGSYGYGIAPDKTGDNVYVTGFFNASADFDPGIGTVNMNTFGSNDIFFAKYDASNGNYMWAEDIGSLDPDFGSSIAVDSANNVYITGYFNSTADFDPGAGTANQVSVGAYDIFFAKYSPTLVGINGNDPSTVFSFFPNPAEDYVTVECPQKATIEILNISGQIMESFNKVYHKTTMDLSNLSGGLYFIKVKTDNGITMKKFIKL